MVNLRAVEAAEHRRVAARRHADAGGAHGELAQGVAELDVGAALRIRMRPLPVAQPLDLVVVVREEPQLGHGEGEVGDERGDGHQQGDHPVGRRAGERAGEHLVVGGREGWRDGAVAGEEHVPQGDAGPDAGVLDQGEVVHRERHLEVDGPDDARVGRRAEGGLVDHLPAAPERLVLQRRRGEEEDDHGAGNAVHHPPDDAPPPEQQVLGALLV